MQRFQNVTIRHPQPKLTQHFIVKNYYNAKVSRHNHPSSTNKTKSIQNFFANVPRRNQSSFIHKQNEINSTFLCQRSLKCKHLWTEPSIVHKQIYLPITKYTYVTKYVNFIYSIRIYQAVYMEIHFFSFI